MLICPKCGDDFKATAARPDRCPACHAAAKQAERRAAQRKDPVALERHRENSRQGNRRAREKNRAAGLTSSGTPRKSDQGPPLTAPPAAPRGRHIALPKCADCPPRGNRCGKCRAERERERNADKIAAKKAAKGPYVPSPWEIDWCPACVPGVDGVRASGKGACPSCRVRSLSARRAWREANEPGYADQLREAERVRYARRMANEPGYAEHQRMLRRKSKRTQRDRLKAAVGYDAEKKPARAAEDKRLGAAKRTTPRCPECPPVGPPCKPCYNKHKRAAKGGTGERIARERARVIPKAPRQKADVLTAVVPAATPLRDRSWELDTCVICMSKGRWGGRAACNRHADQVAPRAAGKGA